MSEWIDREKAIEDLQNGDPSQLYDMEDIKYWLNCLPLAQPEGRSGVFIPDITVKNLRKAPLEAVGELLVVGEMEDIVLPSVQLERDIPKKPKEIMDSTWGIHKKQAACPECDYYLGYVAFLGGRKGKRITYCETCGQAIDWEGWNFDE